MPEFSDDEPTSERASAAARLPSPKPISGSMPPESSDDRYPTDPRELGSDAPTPPPLPPASPLPPALSLAPLPLPSSPPVKRPGMSVPPPLPGMKGSMTPPPPLAAAPMGMAAPSTIAAVKTSAAEAPAFPVVGRSSGPPPLPSGPPPLPSGPPPLSSGPPPLPSGPPPLPSGPPPLPSDAAALFESGPAVPKANGAARSNIERERAAEPAPEIGSAPGGFRPTVAVAPSASVTATRHHPRTPCRRLAGRPWLPTSSWRAVSSRRPPRSTKPLWRCSTTTMIVRDRCHVRLERCPASVARPRPRRATSRRSRWHRIMWRCCMRARRWMTRQRT